MTKRISHDLGETAKIAKDWLDEVSNSSTSSHRALVVGLSGNLGAGKTAFTKAVAKELGVTEEVTSPTFVIMKMYDLKASGLDLNVKWKRLIHIDAYRLERAEELEVLKFEGLATDRENLILIEWPENVKDILVGLKNYSQILFKVPEGDDQKTNREISF